MAQVRKAKTAPNVSCKGNNDGIRYSNINHAENACDDDYSTEDNGILSRLLSPRKSIDKQNYFNLVPDEICTTIFQDLDLESLCKGTSKNYIDPRKQFHFHELDCFLHN
jgi:hypothetical protein